MASDTALARNEQRDLALGWSRRLSLRHRILAVNIFAVRVTLVAAEPTKRSTSLPAFPPS